MISILCGNQNVWIKKLFYPGPHYCTFSNKLRKFNASLRTNIRFGDCLTYIIFEKTCQILRNNNGFGDWLIQTLLFRKTFQFARTNIGFGDRLIQTMMFRKTCQFVRTNVGFGDWLILTMMSNHLDIKLFTEILKGGL